MTYPRGAYRRLIRRRPLRERAAARAGRLPGTTASCWYPGARLAWQPVQDLPAGDRAARCTGRRPAGGCS
jgi:hypothetical protein